MTIKSQDIGINPLLQDQDPPWKIPATGLKIVFIDNSSVLYCIQNTNIILKIVNVVDNITKCNSMNHSSRKRQTLKHTKEI